jgi:hypothetical protein
LLDSLYDSLGLLLYILILLRSSFCLVPVLFWYSIFYMLLALFEFMCLIMIMIICCWSLNIIHSLFYVCCMGVIHSATFLIRQIEVLLLIMIARFFSIMAFLYWARCRLFCMSIRFSMLYSVRRRLFCIRV